MISKIGEFISEFLVTVIGLFFVVAMIKAFTLLWGVGILKIISLESVGLGDSARDQYSGERYSTTRWFGVGHKYDGDNGPTIVSIDVGVRAINYIIKADNGHLFVVPLNQYIAEYADEEDEK